MAGWTAGRPHTVESRYLMGAAKLGITAYEYAEQIRAGNRWCSGHHAWEPATDFPRHKRRVDGLDTRCKTYAREYAREAMRKRRAA